MFDFITLQNSKILFIHEIKSVIQNCYKSLTYTWILTKTCFFLKIRISYWNSTISKRNRPFQWIKHGYLGPFKWRFVFGTSHLQESSYFGLAPKDSLISLVAHYIYMIRLGFNEQDYKIIVSKCIQQTR